MKKRLTRKEKIIDSLIGCAKKERYNDDSYCGECRFKRGKCRAKLMDAASDYIQLNGRVAAPEIGQDRTGEVYYLLELKQPIVLLFCYNLLLLSQKYYFYLQRSSFRFDSLLQYVDYFFYCRICFHLYFRG